MSEKTASQEQIQKFNEMVEGAKNIVFFGGAGVSTESGIPDFRSVDGLYNQKFDYPPEQILSHTFFLQNPEYFFKFYREKMIPPADKKPNIAHEVLARWEAEGKLSAVVTQNIDGFHQLAGSKKVLELHGSVRRNQCMKCGKSDFLMEDIKKAEGVPRCTCGGIIKPDVVLYEEEILEEVVNTIVNADLMIVAGSSLTVYPAAKMVPIFKYCNRNPNRKLVIINLDETPMDDIADLVIHAKIGSVFSQL